MIHVRRTGILLGVLLRLLSGQAAIAGTAVPVAGEQTSLLYLDAADWEKQSATRKLALTADFMRMFCTVQTMSPAVLADCLDRDKADAAMFDRAIACVAAISAGR